MTYEIMVLFGGSVVLLSLKRKKAKTKDRTRGFLKIFLLLVDGLILFGGLGLLLFGVMNLAR